MLLLFFSLCSFQALIQSVDGHAMLLSVNDRRILSKSTDVRIIGGEVTDIKKYPFLVSVQRRHVGHICGGTHIAPRFVLSAAHCMVRRTSRGNWIKENPNRFYAIAGATYVYLPSWSSTQVELIDGIFPHTNFHFTGMHHDIGLFRLRRPFLITPYVKYAILPSAYDENIFQRYKEPCTVVGWGTHTPGTHKGSGTYLRHVKVPLIPSDKCTVKGVDPKMHLCAGWPEGGRDACHGDSGGPLLCNGTQVGIVSWGEGCASPNSAGVYSRLDLYPEWINETIIKNSASQRRVLIIVIVLALISAVLRKYQI